MAAAAAHRLVQRLLAKYKDERESLVIHVYEEAITADIGDDVNVQNVDGSPYKNSPYRIVAMEFKWPASRWELELANYRDTFDRRVAELGEKMRIANEFGQGATNFYPFQVAENVKGQSRHAVVDLTIPPEAIATNRVKISNLRLRPFESYAESVAGSQTPTSAANTTAFSELNPAAGSNDTSVTLTAGSFVTVVDTATLGSTIDRMCHIEYRGEISWGASTTSIDVQFELRNGVTLKQTYPVSGVSFVAFDDSPLANVNIVIQENLVSGDFFRCRMRANGANATALANRLEVYFVPTHTHDVTITGHSHPAGIVETAYTSPSVSIFIDGVDKTSEVTPAGPFTADTSNIDLTRAIIWTQGVHTIEFREDTADKLGRIHASGFIQTFIKSK